MPDLREQLQTLFGLDEFRPAQREVIEDVLGGVDVLCVMPTGAGKSLCYQLPAAVQGGLSIVVSPLISLMEDQVQQLRDEGIDALVINSTLTPAHQREVMARIEEGFEGLLYVAPERFFAASFAATLARLRVKLFIIDEAHCISQWGHDFRPDYSRLGEVRRTLGAPPAIALTATATEDVRADIIRLLGLKEPSIYVTGFDRPNLRYGSRTIPKARDKDDELVTLLRAETGSGIVYCATRKNVDAVTQLLSQNLRDRSVFAYHAGMDLAARTANQERFMQTPRSIAVATNAFGMGINKPDVRFVVHYNLPGTLEAYYQEAGRAGRDGRSARCTILFSYQDRRTQEFFIDNIGQDQPQADPKVIEQRKEHATRKLEMLIRYAQTHNCRRQMILDYFGDESAIEGCQCDVCSRGNALGGDEPVSDVALSDDLVLLCRQLLSAMARLHGKFGVGVVAEVLAGTHNERTQRWGFEKLSVFGLLRAHTPRKIVAMLHRLMEAGLARQRDPEGVKFRPVVELTPAGVAVMKAQQLPPASLVDLAPGHTRVSFNRGAVRIERAGRVDDSTAQIEPMDAEVSARFDKLRALRQELSRERQLPSYCICHDSTLRQIAREVPANPAELERIKGMGPHKVRMYGARFLNALGADSARVDPEPEE